MESELTWKLIGKYFQDNPQNLVTHHIESYNDFFKRGIFQIFKEKNPIEIFTMYDTELEDYRCKCIMYFGGKEANKIYFGKPIIYDSNENIHYMYPNEARLRNMSYGMTIHYDIDIEFINVLEKDEEPEMIINDEIEGGVKKGNINISDFTAAETAKIKEQTEQSILEGVQKREITLEKIYLGKFPIMLQSDFCILKNLPRNIRFNMGECANDLGGYFIVDGKEKTVVSQEKFGDNMLYVRKYEKDDEQELTYLCSAEIKSVSENVSKPRRNLSVSMVAPSSKLTNKNIVVSIPNVRKSIPLFILFRALGISSDKKIIESCLLDIEKNEHLVDLFIPSVHDSSYIFNQQDALFFIGRLTKGKTIQHALEILSDYFLPHVGETNFIEKSYFLGHMVSELLKVHTKEKTPTDRDSFKYKRIELVGSLMYDLFRDYFTLQQKKIQTDFEKIAYFNQNIYAKNLYGLILQNYTTIFRQRIVEDGFKKAMKGNWGVHTHTKRVGIVQDLNRLSFNSMISHLRKTNLPLDSSLKVIGPRILHGSQWGFLDPIDTPDGGSIGLHKHLSISSFITQHYSRDLLIEWMKEKVSLKPITDFSNALLAKHIKVFVNGYWCGIVENPIECVEKMKLFRRNALIPVYTSITFEFKSKTIYIYTDGGRISRPVFYYDQENKQFSYENKEFQDLLQSDNTSWLNMICGFNERESGFSLKENKIYELNELYKDVTETNPAKLEKFINKKAVLDYIDSNESEQSMIALSKETLTENKKFTHVEIHPSLIFGVMCNLINFPENNPGTRNSFSCGQSKQACSLYHTNYQLRLDKTGIVLNYGQTPLVKSRYMEYINNEENSYGENTIVAIMCYTGYNVEDAILVNEGAIQRGLFKTTYYTTYETHEEKEKMGDATINKVIKNIEDDKNVVNLKQGFDYSKLDKNGLIKEETEVDEKTIMIGMASEDPSKLNARTDMSKGPKKGQKGIVDKSFITEGEEGTRIAKVRIREIRQPAIGDKMASRAGQKGTVGLVIPESDMPFTKDGLKPDLIINPHAIPSRMTIGQFVECITGKASANIGCFGDCTAFINDGSKVGMYGEVLTKCGYHSSGNEVLYNGMTGEQLESEVFIGPNYYMRLKHMVKDKINYRALGPKTALTKQPVGGRANDGGLRIGEMERDGLISHGASEFLRESMMERADKYAIAVCNSTGLMALYNPEKNLFLSPLLDGPIKFIETPDGNGLNLENITKYGRSFSIISVPYSFKLLMQELQTINIQMRIITDENIDQIENMTNSVNIEKLLSDKMTSKEIVKEINNALKNKTEFIKTNVETPITPESPGYNPLSPYESPGYHLITPEDSPGYHPITPEDSPGYQPMTPEDSPGYQPQSPNTPPPKQVGMLIDSPDSDDSYIPPPPSDTPPEDRLQLFNIDDLVNLLSDANRERIWKITKIKDPFIHIETTDTEGLQTADTVKIVTANDIQKQGEYNPNNPVSPSMNVPSNQTGGAGMNGPPTINIAPVFKIMNGGSDFSTGGEEANPEVMNTGENMSSVIPQMVMGGSTLSDSSNNEKEKVDSTKELDFSKIQIKKVG